MARFGPKQGKDSENLVVLFEQEFLGTPTPPPPFNPASAGVIRGVFHLPKILETPMETTTTTTMYSFTEL